MQIRFDTRTSLAFLAGLLGLVEQEAVRVILHLDPSPILTSTFGTLILTSIGAGVLKGVKENSGSEKGDGPG